MNGIQPFFDIAALAGDKVHHQIVTDLFKA